MKIITEEDFNCMQPKFKESIIANMDSIAKESFLYYSSVYRHLLNLFILKRTNIKKFDELVRDSKLNFVTVNTENQDFYQYFMNDELLYFYIRNNVHIENLSREELQELESLGTNGYESLTDKLEQFIEKTYKKVIRENVPVENNTINYGPASFNYMAAVDSIVIGMRYDEFNLNGQDDDTWDNNHEAQLEYFENVSNALFHDIRNSLDIPCTIIRYNDFSIKKKKSKQVII